MLLTRHHPEASPREDAGHGVEVGISLPFLAAPPPAVLRGEASLDGMLRGAVSAGARAVHADAFLRHFPGAVPSRVYVGSETCERLLPTREAVRSWIAAAEGSRAALSLVLPPLSRGGLPKAEEAVRELEGVEGFEVVAGDWGTVHRLRTRHPGLAIVLGRLTHKMLRDPRLAEYFDSPQAPAPARSALCRSGELAPGFRALMERYAIGRREVDPFLQPIGPDEWESRSEKLSVHFPYLFVTMGRACLLGAMHREPAGKFLPGAPCRSECRKHAVEFRLPVAGGNGVEKHLLNLGNAYYHAVPPPVTGRILERISSSRQVDRIILTVPPGATEAGASVPAPARSRPRPPAAEKRAGG